MGRRLRWCGVAVMLAVVVWSPSAALGAGWQLTGTTYTSIAYNQGVAFDRAPGVFFFDGVSSTTNSGLYRTDGALSLQAARLFVLPPTAEGYNHAGDLSFDPGTPASSAGGAPGSGGPHLGGRLLLALECYYPSSGGNTCGSGAFGVADPNSLQFLYYVNLDRTQIQKAMWDEISPDGRWIWTSSGADLLVYPAAGVNPAVAARQRAGTAAGIVGEDLGPVLPSPNVTGATFGVDGSSRRLFLSLNLGSSFEVISYQTGVATNGTPTVSAPQVEITIPKTFNDNEPEGLAITAARGGSYPLGGALHWQMLPAIPLWSSILNYDPN
jgi:hypothetical protein